MKKLLFLGAVLLSSMLQAQTYNMLRNNSDTATDCSGTLYDHGGVSGSYFDSSSDNFYILPNGGSSLDLTFTSFSTESCCDRLRIYDNVSGILLGTYQGSGIPNGGNAINIPGGEARLWFTSDGSVRSSGFAMTWSAGGTTTPTANYTASNTNPALRQPVAFTNTSVGGGSSLWFFGDGDSATAVNPSHQYSAPGTYTVSLIQSGCYGADTITGSITVQAASVLTVSPDSLSGSAPCGGIYYDTLQIQYQSGGPSFYDINVATLTDQSYLQAGFETSLSPFVRSATAPISFNSNVVIGTAAIGNGNLQLSGFANLGDGVYTDVNAGSNANYFKYLVNSSTSSRSYVRLGDEINGFYYTLLGLEVYFGNLRIQGSYITSVPLPSNVWNTIEVKNIDYVARTVDVYLNGAVAVAAMPFSYFLSTEIDRIDIANFSSSAAVAYDGFELMKQGDIQAVSLSDTLGITSGTVSIPLTVDLSGALAGMQRYMLEINTNALGADSLILIPLNIDVLGAPVFMANNSCVDFDTTYIGLTYNDSLWVFNTGCDTMDLTSLSASASDYTLLQTSLNIAPGDSALVSLQYTPSGSGISTDTLFFNGNLDTTICLSAESFTAPAIGFDSTSYNASSIGCNDSIPFQFYLYNNGSSANLNWTLLSGTQVFDDFESGTNTNIWLTHGSNQIFNGCYERSGLNALSMMGTNRTSETVLMNLSAGDSVGFWAFPGNGGGTGCENPDGGEDMIIQYRLSGSSFWTTIGNVFNTSIAAAYYNFAIPVSGLMQVRLYQSNYTSGTFDHYRVDDFRIVSTTSSNSFSPNTGITAGGDSVLITGYLATDNLLSGNYTRSIRVQSNDPARPDTSITINLTVIGEPDLLAPSTCLDFDTIFTGGSAMDSVMIINQGCDVLNLTGFSLATTQFTHSLVATNVSPDDTVWIPLSFNPDGTVLGQINDTLTVTNNDSLWKLCLTGLAQGAPIGSFNPDSLSVTVTNCGDSISIPVYLRNAGLSGLDYKMVQGGRISNNINVSVMYTNAFSTERNNIYNAVSAMTDVNVAFNFSTTAINLALSLDTMDILILPEGSSSFYAGIFAPTMQAFLNDGGTIIFGYMNQFLSTTYNIMPLSGSFSAGSPIAISIPSHPIAAGLPSAGMANLSATQSARFTNTTNLTRVIGATGTDQAVVATQPYGNGTAIHIGYDFFQTNTDLLLLLENSIRWGAGLQGPPNFVTATPDSGLVAAGDSVLINININTAGVNNGTYDYQLIFETNDPANNPLILPLHLVVNGTAVASVVDSSCLSFPATLQGAIERDTFDIYNEGCDTLQLTSYTALNADYTIDNLPLSIAPGDTAKLSVKFSPFGVGISTDTMEVSTNDTAVFICVTGSGVGAALPKIDADTISYTLNKCKVIGNKQIRIKNIGQGPMTFDNIRFGGFRDSSQISYNTTGANTIHSFNNLPTSGDSIKLRIIINGDFDAFSERASLYLDGSYWQVIYDNNRYYQLDTIEVFIVGAQVGTLLADGLLDVGLYNTTSVDGLAGSFHRVELEIVQTVNWVSVVGANSGAIPATDSVNRNLLFNAAILPVGTHYTTMIVDNNSPSQPSYRKPVKFTIISEPEMVLSDTCALFTLTSLGDTTSRSVTIYNDGCEPLVISSMTSTSNQFKITQTSGTIPVGDSLVLAIDFIPTSVSNFAASIFIISNDTNRTICLSGQSGAMPIADFTFNDENICIGEVSFDNTNSQYFNSLFWDFGDGITSNQSNPSHIFTIPGTYKVILRTTNSIGFDTLSQFVTVSPLVVSYGMSNDTIQLSDTAFFTDTTPNVTTWIWDFGDGSSSTQQNPSHQYAAQGLYNVKLTVIDGRSCSNTQTQQILVENRIGLLEWQLANAYSLFPNPNNGNFQLRKEQGTWKGLNFRVIDAQGRVVAKLNGSDQQTASFSLGLANGMYQVQILEGDQLKDQQRIIIRP